MLTSLLHCSFYITCLQTVTQIHGHAIKVQKFVTDQYCSSLLYLNCIFLIIFFNLDWQNESLFCWRYFSDKVSYYLVILSSLICICVSFENTADCIWFYTRYQTVRSVSMNCVKLKVIRRFFLFYFQYDHKAISIPDWRICTLKKTHHTQLPENL